MFQLFSVRKEYEIFTNRVANRLLPPLVKADETLMMS